MDLSMPLKRKGIVGVGLSMDSQYLRLARCALEGGKVRVDELREAPLKALDSGALVQALEGLSLSSQTPVAVALPAEGLKGRSLQIPSIPDRDVPDALLWQMRREEEGDSQELMIRSTSLQFPAAEPGKKRFQVWAFPRQRTLQLLQDLKVAKVKAVAGEPFPLSIAAWQVRLDPASEKVRGIFYFQSDRIDFFALKGRQFLDWKALPEIRVPKGGEPLGSSIITVLQHCLEDFLFQHHLEAFDALVLAGQVDPSLAELLRRSLGLRCELLGLSTDQVTYSNEGLREQAPKYALALGLSLFPREAL